jgi:hypothetical protein
LSNYTNEISEKVALRRSKYFFDDSKVGFTAPVVKRESGPQNRLTATLHDFVLRAPFFILSEISGL